MWVLEEPQGQQKLAYDTRYQVLSTKETYLSQRDRGQGIRDKDRRNRKKKKGKRTREREEGDKRER